MEKVKEETEDEMETPTGSSSEFRATESLHVDPTPPHKEKRHDASEKQKEKQKHQQPLKGAFDPTPKIFTQETITAWEKKRPSREGRRSHPPRFSRVLSRLSEEQLSSQEKLGTSMDSLKKEFQNLASRSPLEEQPNDQNTGIPVNFSTASLPKPQEIPAVETVETEPKGLEAEPEGLETEPEGLETEPEGLETEPKGLETEPKWFNFKEDQVPSTSKDAVAGNLTAQPSQASIELKPVDSSFLPFRRPAAVHSVHSKILDPQESVASLSDTGPSVWRMGQRISHWKRAHQRGYHIDQLTQDKDLKNTIMKHERETKAAVPLPLQEVMEEEALAILTQTLKAYQKHLGADHYLTQQLEEQAERVHLRLKGRGVID